MKAAEGNTALEMPRSPTPGPSSPMIYPASEPVIDFNDLNDEDYLQETDDGDNKLVDLDTFKMKLQKKVLDGGALRK